jgi:hypothetical protein
LLYTFASINEIIKKYTIAVGSNYIFSIDATGSSLKTSQLPTKNDDCKKNLLERPLECFTNSNNPTIFDLNPKRAEPGDCQFSVGENYINSVQGRRARSILTITNSINATDHEVPVNIFSGSWGQVIAKDLTLFITPILDRSTSSKIKINICQTLCWRQQPDKIQTYGN